MSYTLKKTTVIGIGGTGIHAMLFMKQKLLKTCGEIPPMIKFLGIDTADKDALETKDGVIELSEGEFLKIEVKNPASLIRTNKEVKEWIPDDIPKFALTSGAKQVRALGRLALFANSSRLEAKLQGLLSSIRDYRIERVSKYELFSENIMVNIVCSLAGGTGAGCFLDVAMLIRENLKTTDKLMGYFLLPDIFTTKPATENVEPNAYAAIKEINYFFSSGSRHRYMLGGKERCIEGGLFNGVYLINKLNKRSVEYSNIKDLEEFLGLGLFLHSSATGKAAADVVDNLEAQLLGKKYYGMPTVFCSFGVSEVEYRGDWYAELFAKKIALNVVQKIFMGGEVADGEKFTRDFVKRIGIEEHEADDVIDAILVPGALKKFPFPPDYSKDVIGPSLARRDSFLNEIRQDVKNLAKTNIAQLKADKVKMLEQEIDSRLSMIHGLEFTKNFLRILVGILSEYKEEMSKERNDKIKLQEDMKFRFDQARSEVEQASRALFGARAKMATAFELYKRLVDKEAETIIEIERRERAIEFFAYMIDVSDKWFFRLEGFGKYCSVLTQDLVHDIEHMEKEGKKVKPFVEELKIALLEKELPYVEPADFIKWLKDAKQINVMEFAEMGLDEMELVLVEFGCSHEKAKDIMGKRVDEVLKGMSQSEKMKYITLLDSMASPLWQYDQGMICGDKKTENIYLFGVEDPDDTVFVPEDIKVAIATPYEPSLVGTGDPAKVICLKVEAAVPAFVVSNISRYREKYMNIHKPFSYHIHKEWEKQLPDLFPGAEQEEARRYWSLGLATVYNLIAKKGEYYYIRSEKKGERTKSYQLKLGQGRVESMKAFFADAELVQETKGAIERITEKEGTKKIIDELTSYGRDIETKASKQTEEIRKQIELELQDIEDYVNSLLSL
ncbi:MAG: hypothetical protein A2Y62_09465 [Candidatus Fischerbacteria bacterium RBG_13_37_8]|uniref:Uncharacterized protein n=1 Tax=Candidatus Fischerbacteria bacterium RBG_13_37_8 TaxID=1817863 RepID=A0A1F5VJT4_9BACT|nr:MAG: hypothetical protein A2Y62_09465 [Candidatus Fischerbacteria bacterium RBG_13_37_8]